MRICIFTENNYRGGLDTFLFNLIKSWPKNKDVFTLVCNKDHPGLFFLEANLQSTFFIKYDFLFTTKIFHGKSNNIVLRSKFFRILFYFFYRLLEYPLILPYFIIKLSIFFKKNDFDKLLIVNGGYPGSLICRCASISWYLVKKKKSILNFHNFSQKSNIIFSLIERFLDYFIFKNSCDVVSVSKVCLNSISNRKVSINPSKLKVIYNGIDFLNEKINEINSNTNYLNNYCIMLGTFESRKGHYFLFKSFKLVLIKYPDIKLHIYGEGKEHEKKIILRYIDELELSKNIILNNFIDNPFQVIKDARILLVPSQSYESFGLTIIEAMSLGIPIVATNVGGIPEVIENSKAGLLSNKDDINSFAQNILSILNSNKLAEYLSKNGKIYYNKNFTASKMSTQYHNLINNE